MVMPTGFPRPLLDGLPLPYSGLIDTHGKADVPRVLKCKDNNLCGVCGLALTEGDEWFFDSGSIAVKNLPLDGIYLHNKCAKLTKAVCPFLKESTPQKFSNLA